MVCLKNRKEPGWCLVSTEDGLREEAGARSARPSDRGEELGLFSFLPEAFKRWSNLS